MVQDARLEAIEAYVKDVAMPAAGAELPHVRFVISCQHVHVCTHVETHISSHCYTHEYSNLYTDV